MTESTNSRHIGNPIKDSLLWRIPLNDVILFFAAVMSLRFFVTMVLSYDNTFVHLDFYRHVLPETLRDGLPLQWRDVVNLFQPRETREFQPHFLSDLIAVLDQKARLFLYDTVLVLPAFSPIAWAIELLIGPYFLFRAVENLTDDRRAAIAATTVYLSTLGFLSGFTMALLPGKNLSNVIVILCIYLGSAIAKETAGRRQWLYQSAGARKYLLLLVIFAGLFVDEMSIFAFFLMPILFPQLFFPNGLRFADLNRMLANGIFLALPGVMFLGIVLFVVPEITQKYFGFRPDYLGSRLSAGLYGNFSWWLVYQNAKTLFGFAAVPDDLSRFISYPKTYPGMQTSNLFKWVFLVLVIAAAGALSLHGKDPARRYLRTMPVLFFALFLFLTVLSVRTIPIVTGYYYGSIFSVLFAIFAGLCYGALSPMRPSLRTAAAVGILYLVVVGITNFGKVSRGWAHWHNEELTRGTFQTTLQLAGQRKLQRKELLAIWQAWKDGAISRYLDENAVSSSAVYLLAELQALDLVRSGKTPPRNLPVR
jgi:hypothetical protein